MLVERIGRPYPCPRDTALFELARKRPLSSITAPYPRIRLYREDTADTAGRCKGGAETSSLCPHPSPFNLGADTGWDTLQIRWICHNRMWRITSSSKHSTVWDGNETLFDLNFQAMGISPNECFSLAFKRQLKPGNYLKVNFAQHYTVESARRRR